MKVTSKSHYDEIRGDFYDCPSCEYGYVEPSNSFCSNCGIPLEFDDGEVIFQSFHKLYKKGTTLDESFNKFINDSLVKSCSIKQIQGGYTHDIEVKFKKDTNIKIIIE